MADEPTAKGERRIVHGQKEQESKPPTAEKKGSPDGGKKGGDGSDK